MNNRTVLPLKHFAANLYTIFPDTRIKTFIEYPAKIRGSHGFCGRALGDDILLAGK